MMEQEYYDISSPLFLFNEEIAYIKSMKHRNMFQELVWTMTDSDLMNIILDKKSERDDFYKQLIFRLEFEIRRRQEEKYWTSWWKKSMEQLKQELNEKKRMISISEVIGAISWLQITSVNRNYRCPLPDHKKDNTPSFHIYENSWTWRCFWCQKWWSAVDFIMHYNKCDTKTAIDLFLKNF